MSPSLANFLFEAVNLVLLMAALGLFVFKPVRRALDAERTRHAGELADGARVRAEAEAALASARDAHDSAAAALAEERRAITTRAREEAAQLRERAQRDEQLARRKLEQDLASEKVARAAELAETLGRIAAESVRQLLETLEAPALDLALTRAACSQLATLATSVEQRGSALVESARPLDAESKRLLASALADGIRERVVPELGAGVRVTTGAGQVDATASAIARRAALELTRAAGVAVDHG